MFQTKCDCPWSPGVTPCSAEPTGQWLLQWPVQPPGPLFCLIQALLSTCWSSAACSCLSLLFTLSFTILTFQIFYPSASLPGYLSPPGFCPQGCVPPLCWCRGNCKIAEVCSSQKKTGGPPARPQVLSWGRIGGGWEREEGSRWAGASHRVEARRPGLSFSDTNFNHSHSSEPSFPSSHCLTGVLPAKTVSAEVLWKHRHQVEESYKAAVQMIPSVSFSGPHVLTELAKNFGHSSVGDTGQSGPPELWWLRQRDCESRLYFQIFFLPLCYSLPVLYLPELLT